MLYSLSTSDSTQKQQKLPTHSLLTFLWKKPSCCLITPNKSHTLQIQTCQRRIGHQWFAQLQNPFASDFVVYILVSINLFTFFFFGTSQLKFSSVNVVFSISASLIPNVPASWISQPVLVALNTRQKAFMLCTISFKVTL